MWERCVLATLARLGDELTTRRACSHSTGNPLSAVERREETVPARPGLAGWGTRPHTASLAKQQQQQQVPCDARDALQGYARI